MRDRALEDPPAIRPLPIIVRIEHNPGMFGLLVMCADASRWSIDERYLPHGYDLRLASTPYMKDLLARKILNGEATRL